MGKLTISDQQLYDYIYCPTRYAIIHETDIPTADHITVSSLIRPVINRFLLELMNGNVKSTDWLKNKWDIVCKKYPGYIDNNRLLYGVSLLVNLFQYCRRNETQIIDMDSPFEVFTPHTIVTGKMGAISMRKNKFELIVFNTNQKQPVQTDVDNDIRYTLNCMAFRAAYSKDLTAIRVVHVKTGTEYTTYRTREDYVSLTGIIDNVAKAIESKLYYPRHNVMCSTCMERNLCKGWVY